MVLACVLLRAGARRREARARRGSCADRGARLGGRGPRPRPLLASRLTLRVDFCVPGPRARPGARRAVGRAGSIRSSGRSTRPWSTARRWCARLRCCGAGPLRAGPGAGRACSLVAGFVDARERATRSARPRSFFGVAADHPRPRRRRATPSCATAPRCTAGRASIPERRAEPLSYYHREGPVGQLFAELDRRAAAPPGGRDRPRHGHAGRLRAAGRRVTFYEIDRLVRDIAFDPALLHLRDGRPRPRGARCAWSWATRASAWRRCGASGPGERYDLIVVDAFTSDAIPVHLLTREAAPALPRDAGAARHPRPAHLQPLPAPRAGGGQPRRRRGPRGRRLLQHDDAAETARRRSLDVGRCWPGRRRPWASSRATRAGRPPLEPDPAVGVWTDDFHNLLSVFKW